LALEDTKERFEKKTRLRKICFSLTLFAISTFFTIDLAFDNLNNVNILPQFIFGIMLILSVLSLNKHTKANVLTFVFGGLYIINAFISYLYSIRFLSVYSYIDLMNDKDALKAYLPIQITALTEAILLIAFLVFITLQLRRFIMENTGASTSSSGYGKTEKEFHTSLIRRTYIFTALGAFMGITKLISVFLNSDMQILYAFVDDFDMRPIASSSLPWFGVVVVFAAIIFIAYSLYYFSLLKDEVKMKYTLE